MAVMAVVYMLALWGTADRSRLDTASFLINQTVMILTGILLFTNKATSSDSFKFVSS